MAESKPTKLQMAKEAQKLIDAAGDMSVAMDLDPPIKIDYLIDLKNKTVTVAYLQNVITNLQTDIKRDAPLIEPTDKFQSDTHKVLADLNIKVPRPVVDEAVEEDDIMPTSSPPMMEETEEVVEEEKPIKKVKKNAAGTTEKIKKEKTTDEFGFIVGLKSNIFANAIKETPMTMKEVRKADWNTTGNQTYGCWGELVKMGAGIKIEDGKMAIKKDWSL